MKHIYYSCDVCDCNMETPLYTLTKNRHICSEKCWKKFKEENK
jgi:hypothetical protein